MELYCIHLKEQEDRLKRLTSHLEEKEAPVQLNIVDGIRAIPGSLGCTKSHKRIINYAKHKNLDEIIVIEDDIQFVDNFDIKYERIYKDLPEDWDILVGGVSWIDEIKERVNSNLVKIGDFSATHFMVYRNKCYDKLLVDMKGENIDRFIGGLAKCDLLNVYCTTPFIAIQFDGFSTIRNTITEDYENFYLAQKRINEM